MNRSIVRRIIGPGLNVTNGAWLCVLAALSLSVLGLYAIDLGVPERMTTGLAAAGRGVDDGPIALSGIVGRQAVFIMVGMLAALMVALPHSRFIRLVSWPLMVLVIGLLVFLLLPFVPASLVTPRNGARAWIDFGPVDFQPAELAKIAYVLTVADYLRFRDNHRTLLGLIPPALITVVPVALITLQPDLGTAMLFAPAIFAMLVASGARIKHLATMVLIAILGTGAAFPLLKPHQQARIQGLIRMVSDPQAGADDINYQSTTAQRLIGAGGVWGLPEGKCRALVRFNRLPERHNDMILAIIINRFGLVGGLCVAVLYGVWLLGCYFTAASTRDGFGRLIVVGLAAIVAAQTLVNVGMTVGVLPIIGVTLPFVSYGGSSMLTGWAMTGLVMCVALRRDARLARQTFEFDEEPYDPARISTAHRAAVGTGGLRR